ncbi:murein transglycosylase [Blastomyces dermatitidis ER-3]|uniref:Murein transglycosylase n=1 Tax=Ajellomyces dermatitidis (strain ER-3 / ATCC MYA-2586) TaxID=559297 RepID=A0ABM9YFX0_AJEDR|nr:murein transglycosylase [Blastomyces dermatitidis ER-3]EEQ85060.2 murein transglycosylase [Blastomyces dermatitidis ER-3]
MTMKTGIFTITALSFLGVTEALPRPYRPQNAKRATLTKYVIVDVPGVVVWVNQNGKPIKTETKGLVSTYTAPLSTVTQHLHSPKGLATKNVQLPVSPLPPLPLPPPPSAAAPTPPGGKSNVVDLPNLPPLPSPSKPSLPLPLPPPLSSPKDPAAPNLPTKGLGVCYAPYRSDGGCKSEKEIDDDFSKLGKYNVIRFYGVDCDQVPKIVAAAKKHNKKLFAGIFDINDLDNGLHTLIEGAKSAWPIITTVSIGNELVNNGQASADAVVKAVNTARSKLRGAGYKGPVVTVDTFVALIDHPELCKASDYCAANCHAFFDPNIDASRAGEFVKDQMKRVSAAAGGGKMTIITESGWPKSGQSNGKAVPSKKNQQLALQSLNNAFANDDDAGLFLFSAFDDPWKKDIAGTFGSEKFWGIL